MAWLSHAQGEAVFRANNVFPGNPYFDRNGKEKGPGNGKRDANLETRISLPGDLRGKRK
jgi:hypothetical protein